MRIGFIQHYSQLRLDFARQTGFKSLEIAIAQTDDILPENKDWKAKADQLKAKCDQAGLRISCLGGFYVNHFDPQNAKTYETLTQNVILLAEYLKVPVVAGFSGKLMDQPLEKSVEPFKKVWTNHAKFAEDHGVKIAFEHCPMGTYHLPPGGNNCMCTPLMWEACFNEVPSDALGLEWDPSHLIPMMIDPIGNLQTWGSKVFHVHAKDAKVYRALIGRNGIYAPGSIEHCMVGFGDTDWRVVIKELIRAGYRNDLTVEGWHDSVYNSSMGSTGNPAGMQIEIDGEDLGLILAYRYLSTMVDEP